MNELDTKRRLFLYICMFTVYGLALHTPTDIYRITHDKFHYKIFALYAGFTSVVYSMLHENRINDVYIVPICLFLNFFTLLPIIMNDARTMRQDALITLFGLLYILITFFRYDFSVHRGTLINPNVNWIIISTLVLIHWYVNDESNYTIPECKTQIKYGLVFLILIPMLFPLKHFLKYRILTLIPTISIYYYFTHKKLNESQAHAPSDTFASEVKR